MISDERLRTAAQIAGKALADSLPEPEDCQHTFSPAFERKMNRLIARTKHQGAYTALKRVACFFLVLLLSGGVWLTVDAEARERFFGWISEQTEDAERYFYPGEGTKPEDIVHYRIDVPEGYWLEQVYEDSASLDEYYLNETGQIVSFSYRYVTEHSISEVYIGNTSSEKKKGFVHDMPADIYISHDPEDANTVIWTDTNTGALFDVTAHMDEDDLLALAESVVPTEK